jgi:hypothetical protein
MNDEKLSEMQKDLEDMKRLLHGDPTTTKGGVAQFVNELGTTIYGDPRYGGGLVSDVMALKKVMYIGYGIMLALQAGLQILFHFWKP